MPEPDDLGVFYLGRKHDLARGQTGSEPILYDSRDLTTHAVVLGMTGSGKTGLCLALLEEAALDRIPALVIDPKGDIANLLLTFPNLRPEDFRPWIDEGQAQRLGMTPDEFAAAEADKWVQGLTAWGQDGARIQRFRDAVELRVYSPGSTAARPLAILNSLAAPPAQVRDDADLFRDLIGAATAGLLSLLGIDADPIRSREHILISNILQSAWTSAKDLDIAQLIGQIQSPPFQRIGAMAIDTFFPPGDRQNLAMSLNNLLASPSFAAWRQGDPLDLRRLLHTETGKPCISIMSIAHLPESQRMFFVTLLLHELLAWIRRQSGTSSLRAILYMDEIFGYFPPTANPPAKQPMLTLLKQARAYGLGIVLATQNPVDLDYKGLSNTGTWFLGRLQTERDKLRVLEGLEGASVQRGATFDRAKMDATLAGLKSRIFVMNNVHDDGPVVFESRWAMSYLRGPLARAQLQQLCHPPTEKNKDLTPQPSMDHANAGQPATTSDAPLASRQQIPAGVPQVFAVPMAQESSGQPREFQAALLGTCRLHFVDASQKVDAWREISFVNESPGDGSPTDLWSNARPLPSTTSFREAPDPDASFGSVPAALVEADQYAQWQAELIEFANRQQELILWQCPALGAVSLPEESEADFRVRLEQLASEQLAREDDEVRRKSAPKLQKLRERIARASRQVDREQSLYRQKWWDSIAHAGSTLFGALLGRKKFSVTNVSKASTSMRSIGRAARQRTDVGRATENLESLQVELESHQVELDRETNSLQQKWNAQKLPLEKIRIRPKPSDTSVVRLAVAWIPS
jgi:hypothetical protein